MVVEGALTAGHARALLGFADPGAGRPTHRGPGPERARRREAGPGEPAASCVPAEPRPLRPDTLALANRLSDVWASGGAGARRRAANCGSVTRPSSSSKLCRQLIR